MNLREIPFSNSLDTTREWVGACGAWEAPAELAAVPGAEAAPGYEGVGKGSGDG